MARHIGDNESSYTSQEIFKAFRTVSLNSVIMCIAAFLFINFLYNSAWYFTSYHYISRPIFKYNYIDFVREKGEIISATDTTVVFPVTSSAENDHYNNLSVTFTSGKANNTTYKIMEYFGDNHTARVERMDTIPEPGTGYFVNNTGWYPRAVKNIYSAGPLLCLGLAVLFFGLLYASDRRAVNARLFFIWAFVWSLNYLLVEWMAVPYLRYSGIGVLTRYWYWEERERFISALVALIVLLFYGRFIAHYFLQMTPAMKYMKKGNNRVFALYIIVLPLLVSAVLIAGLRLAEDWELCAFMAAGSLLMGISTYLRTGERKFKVIFHEETYVPRISIGGVVFLAIMAALYFYLATFTFSMNSGLF